MSDGWQRVGTYSPVPSSQLAFAPLCFSTFFTMTILDSLDNRPRFINPFTLWRTRNNANQSTVQTIQFIIDRILSWNGEGNRDGNFFEKWNSNREKERDVECIYRSLWRAMDGFLLIYASCHGNVVQVASCEEMRMNRESGCRWMFRVPFIRWQYHCDTNVTMMWLPTFLFAKEQTVHGDFFWHSAACHLFLPLSSHHKIIAKEPASSFLYFVLKKANKQDLLQCS